MLEADINPNAAFGMGGGSSPRSFIEYGGKLYFVASWNGNSLYSYDGDTVSLEYSFLDPKYMTVYDNKLYFASGELKSYGGWTINHEADIFQGTGESDPSYLTVYDDKLYFSADDGIHGRELWSYDGDTAIMTADLIGISNAPGPTNLIAFNDRLYFGSWFGGIYCFDGDSIFGIPSAVDLPYYEDHVPHQYYAEYNGKLYFAADDNTGHGNELWSFDGDTTIMEADIQVGPSDSNPNSFYVYEDTLYFGANDGGGGRIWSYDGTNATVRTPWPSGVANNFTSYCDRLYYHGGGGSQGLWLQTLDVPSGPNNIHWDGDCTTFEQDYGMFVFNDKLFLGANDGVSGFELWSYTCPELVGIEDESITPNLSAFPNPTTDNLTLRFDKPQSEITVFLFNATGSLVGTKQLNSTQSYEQRLPDAKGLYFIEVLNKDGKVDRLKVVKN